MIGASWAVNFAKGDPKNYLVYLMLGRVPDT